MVRTQDDHAIEVVTKEALNERALILMCHGIGSRRDESAGIYAAFADVAHASGFSSARFDFRGHGTSAMRPVDLTLEGARADLRAIAEVLLQVPDRRLVILAASFAASAGAHIAAELGERAAGLALWNPVVDYVETFLSPETEWGKAISDSSHLLPAGAWGRLPAKDFLLSQRLADEMRLDDTSAVLGSTALPVFVCHGDADEKVPIRHTRDLVRRRTQHGLPTCFLELPGATHGLNDARHVVFEGTLAWLGALVDGEARS